MNHQKILRIANGFPGCFLGIFAFFLAIIPCLRYDTIYEVIHYGENYKFYD